jgi:hypothetical protein
VEIKTLYTCCEQVEEGRTMKRNRKPKLIKLTQTVPLYSNPFKFLICHHSSFYAVRYTAIYKTPEAD